MKKIWLLNHAGYNKDGVWEARTCFELGAYADDWTLNNAITKLEKENPPEYNEELDEWGGYYAFSVNLNDEMMPGSTGKYKDLQSVFLDIMEMAQECYNFGFRNMLSNSSDTIDQQTFKEYYTNIYNLICKVRRADEKKLYNEVGCFTTDFSDL